MNIRETIQKEAVDSVEMYAANELIISQRVGKTKIAAKIVEKFILSRPISKKPSILYVTAASKQDVIDEFNKWIGWSEGLELTTYRSLHKYTGFYEMVIFDEHQHITPKNTVNFFNKQLKTFMILAMSGTKTTDSEKLKIYSRLKFKTVYSYGIKQASGDIISDFNVIRHNMNLSQKGFSEYNRAQKSIEKKFLRYTCKIEDNKLILSNKSKFLLEPKDDYFVLKDLVRTSRGYITDRGSGKLDKLYIENWKVYSTIPPYLLIQRQKILGNSKAKTKKAMDLIESLKGDRVLIFCTSIEQCEQVCKNTFHSESDNLEIVEEFNQKKINTLALVNKGGTGYNFKEVDHVIIIQMDSDRNGSTTQKITRGAIKDVETLNVHLLVVNGTKDERYYQIIKNKLHED